MLGHINFNNVKLVLDLCDFKAFNKKYLNFVDVNCLGKAHKLHDH